jgi:hypothetical protein
MWFTLISLLRLHHAAPFRHPRLVLGFHVRPLLLQGDELFWRRMARTRRHLDAAVEFGRDPDLRFLKRSFKILIYVSHVYRRNASYKFRRGGGASGER